MSTLGNQLADPKTGQKKYFKILKKFMKKDICSLIPPISHLDKFIVEAEEKCRIFNDYFKSHCVTVPTSSTLPPQTKCTNLSIKSVDFTEQNIVEHIRKLNSNKAHGHDMISIKMMKMFDDSIAHPLFKIYKTCIRKNYFPKKWKMANVVPVYKKNEKNIVKNYRPISLLPICGKIFEKLIFSSLYTYIFSNGFISDKQSGYRRNDSTVKQLISITHDIHKAFNDGHELRAAFLDISKAFDSVWHDGLIYKLKKIGIEGDMIGIIHSFLSNRMQRVTIDGKYSQWTNIEAGVPQGSLLGPILFLVFINDIVEVVESDIRIFADDTFIYRKIDQLSTQILNSDLMKISQWAWQWKLVFNPDITKQAVEVIFSNKNIPSDPLPLTFNNIPVKRVLETKHLGLILDSKINFKQHIDDKLDKANKGIGVMKQMKKWVDMRALETVYKLYIRPHLEYGDMVFNSHEIGKNEIFNTFQDSDSISFEIESIQYKAARIITGAWDKSNKKKLYELLGWESMQDRRTMRKLVLLHQILNTKNPAYLYDILEKQLNTSQRLINRLEFRNFKCNNTKFAKSFFPSTISDWNNLDSELRSSSNSNILKNRILNKIRPKKALFVDTQDNDKVRHLTMLRLKLSPLKAHKHARNFIDTPDPYCTVCEQEEDTRHFLLLCKSYKLARNTLMQTINSIFEYDIVSIVNFKVVSTIPMTRLLDILLYGKVDLPLDKNNQILRAVLEYISKSKRFDRKV